MKRIAAWVSALVLAGALPALAADTIVFGAAISMTGKLARKASTPGTATSSPSRRSTRREA